MGSQVSNSLLNIYVGACNLTSNDQLRPVDFTSNDQLRPDDFTSNDQLTHADFTSNDQLRPADFTSNDLISNYLSINDFTSNNNNIP